MLVLFGDGHEEWSFEAGGGQLMPPAIGLHFPEWEMKNEPVTGLLLTKKATLRVGRIIISPFDALVSGTRF